MKGDRATDHRERESTHHGCAPRRERERLWTGGGWRSGGAEHRRARSRGRAESDTVSLRPTAQYTSRWNVWPSGGGAYLELVDEDGDGVELVVGAGRVCHESGRKRVAAIEGGYMVGWRRGSGKGGLSRRGGGQQETGKTAETREGRFPFLKLKQGEPRRRRVGDGFERKSSEDKGRDDVQKEAGRQGKRVLPMLFVFFGFLFFRSFSFNLISPCWRGRLWGEEEEGGRGFRRCYSVLCTVRWIASAAGKRRRGGRRERRERRVTREGVMQSAQPK